MTRKVSGYLTTSGLFSYVSSFSITCGQVFAFLPYADHGASTENMSWRLDPQITSRQDRTYPVSWDEDRVRGPQQHPRSSNSLGRVPIMVYDNKKIQRKINKGKSCMEYCPEETMLSHRTHLIPPAIELWQQEWKWCKMRMHHRPHSQVLPSSPGYITSLPHRALCTNC